MSDQIQNTKLSDAQENYLKALNIIKSEDTDADSAISYLSKAANHGLREAQYQLGVIYFKGQYVRKNQDVALEWFEKSAAVNYIPAQFALATLYTQAEKYQQALVYLEILAKDDVPEAQTNLADFYLCSKGVDKDIKKAVLLLTQAANNNDRLAQYRLGLLYYQGVDVPTDYIKARKYIVLAMEQHYLPAYFVMGAMLEHGYGIKKDVTKAYSLYYYCQSYGMLELSELLEDILNDHDAIEQQHIQLKSQEYYRYEPAPE
ncbi:tetratricopeptide repeat protein [Vibrio sp. HN007]|uniref:tetratricopeptide repeat protein n=1 Tax=Vibrio iocasae TaxID=3098914 RepID=UPI0035D4BE35